MQLELDTAHAMLLQYYHVYHAVYYTNKSTQHILLLLLQYITLSTRQISAHNTIILLQLFIVRRTPPSFGLGDSLPEAISPQTEQQNCAQDIDNAAGTSSKIARELALWSNQRVLTDIANLNFAYDFHRLE